MIGEGGGVDRISQQQQKYKRRGRKTKAVLNQEGGRKKLNREDSNIFKTHRPASKGCTIG